MKITITGKPGPLKDTMDDKISKVLKGLKLSWINYSTMRINDEEVTTFAEIEKDRGRVR